MFPKLRKEKKSTFVSYAHEVTEHSSTGGNACIRDQLTSFTFYLVWFAATAFDDFDESLGFWPWNTHTFIYFSFNCCNAYQNLSVSHIEVSKIVCMFVHAYMIGIENVKSLSSLWLPLFFVHVFLPLFSFLSTFYSYTWIQQSVNSFLSSRTS